MNSNCEKHTINMGCCEPVMVWADASDYYTKQEVNQKLATLDAKNLDVEDFDVYSASTKDTIDAVSGDVISEHDRAVAAENALNDQIVSATSGMATQEWVENQGYLTEHQSLSGYATEEYVQDYTYNKATIDSKDAEKLSVSDFQTYSGTVASELSGKASQSLVDALSGTVADEIARATSAETALDDKIDAVQSGLTNDYYTKSETSSKTEIADAITGVDTKNLDVTEFTAYTANTDTRLDNVDYRVDTISGQVADIGVNCDSRLDVLEAWKISAGTDIANLQVGLVSKADASALTDVQTELQAKQDRLIAGDNITIVNNVISAVGGASGITSGQVESMIASATSGMATEQWVESQGYLTEHQSLSGYATEQWVLDKNYITGVDLSNYALKSEIPTVPTSNTAFTNDAGYITSSALNGYAESTAVTAEISAAVSGKTNESDFSAHTANTNIHVTTAQTSAWDAKQNALTAGSGISITNNVISVTGGTEGISSAQCQAQIDQSISGKTNQSDFSAHTANTTVHITSTERNTWNAKADVWVGDETAWSQISGNTQQGVIYLVF